MRAVKKKIFFSNLSITNYDLKFFVYIAVKIFLITIKFMVQVKITDHIKYIHEKSA